MVSSGGAFAEAIFLAYNIAVRTATVAAGEVKIQQDVKAESPKENQEKRKDKRAREEGNGAEDGEANTGDVQEEDKHVDRRARVESEVPEENEGGE